MIASAAMTFSSVSVIGNALRLRHRCLVMMPLLLQFSTEEIRLPKILPWGFVKTLFAASRTEGIGAAFIRTDPLTRVLVHVHSADRILHDHLLERSMPFSPNPRLHCTRYAYVGNAGVCVAREAFRSFHHRHVT